MNPVLEIVFAALFLYALVSLTSSAPQIPGPGLLDYFPGGIAYDIHNDQQHAVVRTVRKLSRKYGRVLQVRLGLNRTIITSFPEDILHIYSSPSLFPRALNVSASFNAFAPNGIFSMSGALHQAVRKKLRHDFKYDMLKSFHVHMVNAITEMCDTLTTAINKAPGQSALVDISEQLYVITFHSITNISFGAGLNRSERIALGKSVNDVVDELMLEFMFYPFRGALSAFGSRRNLERAKKELYDQFDRFIEVRRSESAANREGRSRDMLDAILELDGMEGVNVLGMVAEFAVAGSHTTAQMIAWTMYDICCNPEVRRELVRQLDTHCGDRPLSEPLNMDDMQQLEYVAGVWNETLRLHSIGVGAVKRVTADVTLKGSGTFLPKGSTIIPHHDQVQVDEEFWKDAEKFKPERWMADKNGKKMRHRPGTFLPFALGAQSCAGRFLADYEGPLIVAELFRRFSFRLGCDPKEVVSCTRFVEGARTASKPGGPLDRGLPLLVEHRDNH